MKLAAAGQLPSQTSPSLSESQHQIRPTVPAAKPDISLTQGIRVALVIGNSSYEAVPPLRNPVRDAEAVSRTFRDLGFATVQMGSNLTREGMIGALRNFEQLVENASWAVVYYSGHGIEVNGTNYLIPVDAQLKTDKDLSDEALPLERVLSAVESAKKLRVVILDACRENPFVSQMRRTSATRSVGRGLARVEPEGGTLIAYAAKDGEYALDGTGENSPFAEALVKRLSTPGLEINKVFRLVRDDVLSKTARRQEPFVYGSLPGEDFFFRTP